MPSTIVVLSCVGKAQFPMDRRRKNLFSMAMPSEMISNALENSPYKTKKYIFPIAFALGNGIDCPWKCDWMTQIITIPTIIYSRKFKKHVGNMLFSFYLVSHLI